MTSRFLICFSSSWASLSGIPKQRRRKKKNKFNAGQRGLEWKLNAPKLTTLWNELVPGFQRRGVIKGNPFSDIELEYGMAEARYH